MVPDFTANGNLPPGIHQASWEEFNLRFGTTDYRRWLLAGLASAIRELQAAGCRAIYVDGSFVTTKEEPGDYDACWEVAGVDIEGLDPILYEVEESTDPQKIKYRGELFPVWARYSAHYHDHLEYFQYDRDGQAKGIVVLDLREFQP